jgi:hypothetical protein
MGGRDLCASAGGPKCPDTSRETSGSLAATPPSRLANPDRNAQRARPPALAPAPLAPHGNALPARPARRRRCCSSTCPPGKPTCSEVSLDAQLCHILTESEAEVKRGQANDEACPHWVRRTVQAQARASFETPGIVLSKRQSIARVVGLVPGSTGRRLVFVWWGAGPKSSA